MLRRGSRGGSRIGPGSGGSSEMMITGNGQGEVQEQHLQRQQRHPAVHVERGGQQEHHQPEQLDESVADVGRDPGGSGRRCRARARRRAPGWRCCRRGGSSSRPVWTPRCHCPWPRRVRLFQRSGVVDGVTGHRDHAAGYLHDLHQTELVLRRDAAEHVQLWQPRRELVIAECGELGTGDAAWAQPERGGDGLRVSQTPSSQDDTGGGFRV